MALLTLNGAPVIKGSIRLPRVGVWSADLTLDTAIPISGPVTLVTADGAFSLSGTGYREGVFLGTLSLRVIGGAGGLSTAPGGVGKTLPAKYYENAPLSLVLGDILTACGEKLSPTFDTAVTSLLLRKWTRFAGTGKQCIARLFDNIATSWRILADGTFWVGTDTYPPAPSSQFDVVDRHFGEGRIIIGVQQPFLMPGTLLTISSSATSGTQNVSYVTYDIRPGTIRAEVWFERTSLQS
jgi:hypothetical protein